MPGFGSIIRVPGIALTRPVFREALWYIANRNGWSVDGIATLISHESRFKAGVKNPRGSAVGILQWTKGGAALSGTTVEALAKMSAVEQLIYVEKFFKRMLGGGPPKDIADYILAGWGRTDLFGAPDSEVVASAKDLTTAGAYRGNKEFDLDSDEVITVGELRSSFWRIYATANGKRIGANSVGAVRMTPLPPGVVMWTDVHSDRRTVFNAWLKTNTGAVQVFKTESYPDEDREWFLFEVNGLAVDFPQTSVGFPTIAPKGKATNPEDTAEVPDVPDPLALIKDALSPVGMVASSVLSAVVPVLVIAGIGYIAVQYITQRGRARG